ncbi:MAG: alpha/beta fold hydrolase, partial [Phenylobacterium sp.]
MLDRTRDPVRGEMIDLGGRRLRLVRAGPTDSGRPTIIFEHGAFGCAADWAVVQERLAVKGLASLAYDRAGLGHSDPGPRPRDGDAIVADLEALLGAAGVSGPILLVGHSMGGLMVRLFALTHPKQVVGVVLVDAVTPDVMKSAAGSKAVRAYGRAMHWVGRGARFGLMRPVAPHRVTPPTREWLGAIHTDHALGLLRKKGNGLAEMCTCARLLQRRFNGVIDNGPQCRGQIDAGERRQNELLNRPCMLLQQHHEAVGLFDEVDAAEAMEPTDVAHLLQEAHQCWSLDQSYDGRLPESVRPCLQAVISKPGDEPATHPNSAAAADLPVHV